MAVGIFNNFKSKSFVLLFFLIVKTKLLGRKLNVDGHTVLDSLDMRNADVKCLICYN